MNGMRQQRGVALVAALFLLVALAALGVYIVTLSGVQQDTPIRSADASRAYYAARSGIEAAAYQAVDSGSCPSPNPMPLNLDGFQVQVSCTESTHTESGQTFQVFALTSRAAKGSYGSRNHVARVVRGTVTTAP